MNRRDCFNSRVKYQGQSRADKVTSWRGNSSTVVRENQDSNDNMMINQGHLESIWGSIPNVSSEPFHSSASRYGDHQGKYYGTNPFRVMREFTEPSSLFTVIEPIKYIPQVPIENYHINENELWLEHSNLQGENIGYSLLGNSATHASLPLKGVTTNQTFKYEQPLDLRSNYISQRQQLLSHPFNCSTQEKQQNHQTNEDRSMSQKSPLSWSQVVAEVKETTERISPNIEPIESVSLNNTPSEKISSSVYPVNSLANSNAGRMLTKYISDSPLFANVDNHKFSATPSPPPYMVIKVQNVPWSSSSEDINKIIRKSFYFVVPSTKELPHNVHIMMDRHTGKTCGVAFIEVKLKDNTHVINKQEILNQLSRLPLQGRRLKFVVSSYDELRQKIFYTWAGSFKNGIAVPLLTNENNVITHTENDTGLGTTRNNDFFIGQRDLQSVLQISRNYKVFYNRKCPERSFEYIMSITMNIPWLQSSAVSTCQRDIVYECYKLATDSLRIHTSKPLHSFSNDLLPRFVRTALVCDGFTVKQKNNILKTAHLVCPDDLKAYITVEEEDILPDTTSPKSIQQS